MPLRSDTRVAQIQFTIFRFFHNQAGHIYLNWQQPAFLLALPERGAFRFFLVARAITGNSDTFGGAPEIAVVNTIGCLTVDSDCLVRVYRRIGCIFSVSLQVAAAACITHGACMQAFYIDLAPAA